MGNCMGRRFGRGKEFFASNVVEWTVLLNTCESENSTIPRIEEEWTVMNVRP